MAGNAVGRDADVRMDGGQGLAHVAAVRGAVACLAVVRIDGEVDPLQVLAEELGHGEVGLERIVDDRIRGNGDSAARGGGRPLGAGLEATQQLLAVILGGRAQVEFRGGVLRDDVGLIPALGDDAVHARIRPELLTHLIERHEELDHGVERIHPAPRPGRGVRGLAEELACDLDDAEGRAPHLGSAAAVDHHGRVHASEDAGLQELDLARPAFLGGGADDLDAPREGKGAESGRDGRAGARPAVAMTLWPQAFPMLGRASYSAMMAMVGPAAWPSMVARKAVGSPPTPRSTRAPCCSRNAASQPAAFSSWKQSSGVEWIWCEIFSRSSARRSTVSVTLVLAWSSASAVMLVSRLEGMIDRPLQRVRGPSIVGPAAPAQLLDDLAARGHRPVLSELELGATCRDA